MSDRYGRAAGIWETKRMGGLWVVKKGGRDRGLVWIWKAVLEGVGMERWVFLVAGQDGLQTETRPRGIRNPPKLVPHA